MHNTIHESAFDRGDLFSEVYMGYPGDTEFYLDAAKFGSVLYLGVGTGRIFCKIADANQNIIGIDNSKSMITELTKKHPKLGKDQVFEADVLQFRAAENSLDKVIAPFSFLSIFCPSDNTLLLRKVFSWLRPGGTFVTDIFSPFSNPPFSQDFEVEEKSLDHNRASKVEIAYDHVNQRLTEVATVEKDGEIHKIEMNLFYYYPNELKKLIQESGLIVSNFWGGFDKSIVTTHSDIFVIEATKPQPNEEGFPL